MLRGVNEVQVSDRTSHQFGPGDLVLSPRTHASAVVSHALSPTRRASTEYPERTAGRPTFRLGWRESSRGFVGRGRLADKHGDAGVGGLGSHEREGRLVVVVSEEAPTDSEHERIDDEPVLVDQVVRQ
jgi:hypothetical protein